MTRFEDIIDREFDEPQEQEAPVQSSWLPSRKVISVINSEGECIEEEIPSSYSGGTGSNSRGGFTSPSAPAVPQTAYFQRSTKRKGSDWAPVVPVAVASILVVACFLFLIF